MSATLIGTMPSYYLMWAVAAAVCAILGATILSRHGTEKLPQRAFLSHYAGELPDVIYIFRKPHLALALPPEQLRTEIRKTVIHEIAHYFGIDDDHLDEIGWA